MNDLQSLSRVYNILQQKANMGAGEGGVLVGGARRRRRRRVGRPRRRSYGRGEGDILSALGLGEGVMVGGYRRKRAPSAFNKAVSAYMRRTGATLPQASHAVSGKRGYGSKTRKRSYGRGGVRDDYLYESKADQYAAEAKYNKELEDEYCAMRPDKLGLKTLSGLKHFRNTCKKGPTAERKKDLRDALLKMIKKNIPESI